MPSPTRRRFLASLGAAGAATTAGCLSLSAPDGDLGTVAGAWPMAGRDAGHARRADDGPTDPGTVWRTRLPEVRAAGTPALAEGRLYVPVDAVSDTARHRYRLHALTAATGEPRWQVPLRAEPNGPPAVAGPFAVVTAQRSLERGRVVCFGTKYGEEEWLVDVDARLTAPPTIDDGTVFVPDWAGRVHALSVTDGSVRWSRQVAADGSGRTLAEPVAVADGTVYVGSRAGATGVVALDAETGDRRWSESTRAVTGGPVVHGDRLFVRTHQVVRAFDLDGTPRWSVNLLAEDGRPMAVGPDRVYAPARDALVAITRDGAEAWTHETDGDPVGTPTLAGDGVLLRGEDRLVALSRSDGEARWTATPSGSGRAVVVPEAVFVTDGGRVRALGGG